MNPTVDLFKAIDVVLRIPQNACTLVRNKELIEVNNDIVYNSDAPEVCVGDLYAMPSEDKRPVMLYIHGGGFVAGGKEYREGVSRWFAGEGFSVFNVNYGLCPDYKFPMPLTHLMHALNFIADSADKYNWDTERIMVSGDSAGAYYASMLCAATCNHDTHILTQIKPKANISAAILNCGLYDIEAILKSKSTLGEKIFTEFTGLQDFEDFEFRDLCSPVNLLNTEFPPCFVIHSKYDVFCGGQAELLITRLNELGVLCESYCSKTLLANHCFSLGWIGQQAKKANTACLDFAHRFINSTL